MHATASCATTSVHRPYVTIAMPALNEERYIETAIRSIKPATDAFDWELLVVDGGSTDRTRVLVDRLARSDPRIKLLTNDRRIQAVAVNLAERRADARSGVLVRADCHAAYPERFVERCVAALANHRTASIVVPMFATGATCLQKAIAAAQNSRLGNGGSAHRQGNWSGYVEHGHHAAFDRAAFAAIGGYDERFTHNEDAEFDHRLTASGQRIFLDGDLHIAYFPRDTLRSLARQYFAYGRGRARTILKHRLVPRLRQLAPVGVVLGLLAALAVSPWDARFLTLPLLYAFACLAWGTALGLTRREPCVALSGIAAIVMHVAWGTGFIAECATGRPRGAREDGRLSHSGLAS